MTGIFFLDWAAQAVSLFNVILLIWLGLTVLLNAERRTGGILLAGGGLLMGGAFFISHSAILGYGPNVFTAGQDFWWYLGWAPVICLPWAWYLVMLWYTGYWEARRSPDKPLARLYTRQRFWLALTLLLGVLFVILLLTGHSLPSFSQIAQLSVPGSFSNRGVPGLLLVYPLYALLCMALSLDALMHPGPSGRWLGETARRRARPWLAAASVLLVAVSLLVGWAMVWTLINLEKGGFSPRVIVTTGLLDLIIAGLIGLAVILIGQAVVSYEIFTARTLPRNGLFQHWRRALILASGYSVLVSWSLATRLLPIYSLLLTTLLMTVFFALLAWRSYAERERFIRNLRPFLADSQVYRRILDSKDEETSMDVSHSFQALCKEILETRQACLAPLGVMAPLAGPPTSFPEDRELPSLATIAGLNSGFRSPQDQGLPLEPEQHQGFIWAVPLWSERGLVGALLLGEKRTGGLYTQEEIEIARAVGERLIDLKASAELARRLAFLERQNLTHSQVMDQQARRVLHDEILPLVHTALLSLSSDPEKGRETVELLTRVHRQLSDLLRSMSATPSPEVNRLGLMGALRQVVEQDLAGAFDHVFWQVESEAKPQIEALPPLEGEVLFFAAREALRNAARYGRSSGGLSDDGRSDGGHTEERLDSERAPLEVIIRAECKDGVRLVIEDNGSGSEALSETSPYPIPTGSGQGLALHGTLMAVLGGSLSLDRSPGRYTRVVLFLPTPAWQTGGQGMEYGL